MTLQTDHTIPTVALKRESGFYRQIKDSLRKLDRNLILTRLESWVMLGIPDLLVCDEAGDFHLIELKFTKTNAVTLRPHQVAFLSKHQHASAWILIKKQKATTDPAEVFLYPARDAVDLRMDGLSKVIPAYHGKQPVQWSEIWDLICPIK